MNPLSYHDVAVYCGKVKYKINDNYAYHLQCTRTTGWQLWWIWDGQEKLLGEEYGAEPFCIDVGGITIVGKIPENVQPAAAMGSWNGIVETGEPNG